MTIAQKDQRMEDRKIQIMGIVNLTDDSYYAESRCLGQDGTPDIGRTLRRIGDMLSEGADIIDIGACSTRPGSAGVGEDEEWRRLSPVLEAVRNEYPDTRISVDTYWSSVIRRTHGLIGDFIVNDISAGEDDPDMLSAVAELGLPYIAMHKRGNPATMQQMCSYSDVTEEVISYFRRFGEKAEKAGIREWILDPGFGFAKTVEQNWQMLRELGKFSSLGRKILVGVSRKSMVYKLFGITPEEALPQTQVLHFAALDSGADILRVHDVAEAARTVVSWRKLRETRPVRGNEQECIHDTSVQ